MWRVGRSESRAERLPDTPSLRLQQDGSRGFSSPDSRSDMEGERHGAARCPEALVWWGRVPETPTHSPRSRPRAPVPSPHPPGHPVGSLPAEPSSLGSPPLRHLFMSTGGRGYWPEASARALHPAAPTGADRGVRVPLPPPPEPPDRELHPQDPVSAAHPGHRPQGPGLVFRCCWLLPVFLPLVYVPTDSAGSQFPHTLAKARGPAFLRAVFPRGVTWGLLVPLCISLRLGDAEHLSVRGSATASSLEKCLLQPFSLGVVSVPWRRGVSTCAGRQVLLCHAGCRVLSRCVRSALGCTHGFQPDESYLLMATVIFLPYVSKACSWCKGRLVESPPLASSSLLAHPQAPKSPQLTVWSSSHLTCMSLSARSGWRPSATGSMPSWPHSSSWTSARTTSRTPRT
ncbi:endosomal/lysosomal proton channel TMEM175 isoform X2 [Prionailurus viverrinus]|uniref:endosomal/lysosomal proton channel TMEM175 isoform X2 n=1 Tax=Prionailurus viverrinus TaxID=61388 RepID=UPI001FF64563|nr:endosomal/lysosomal proton channel TMEM175 isoform X2 [Prionailurus viverrinus]